LWGLIKHENNFNQSINQSIKQSINQSKGIEKNQYHPKFISTNKDLYLKCYAPMSDIENNNSKYSKG
jgi:hypothetical protein